MSQIDRIDNLLAGLLSDALAPDMANITISGLTLDSRQVQSGYAFVALDGTQMHGLKFAEKAEQLGASIVLWEREEGIEIPKLSIPMVAVDDLGKKLGDIAARFYGNPSKNLTMIGITGTDGKTSVSHFIAQALNKKQTSQCSVIGTLGIGLPHNLQKATHTTPDVVTVHGLLNDQLKASIPVVAMEVSSHALDQGRVNSVQFDTAVFTNLTRDHLDYHGTIEAYAAAKEKLFYWEGLKHVVLNLDDAMGLRLAKALADSKVRVLGYGVTLPQDLPDAIETLIASNASYDHRGIVATVATPVGETALTAPILGKFNLSNLLAVLATLLTMGYDLADAIERIESVATVPGRMERVDSDDVASEVLVVVDYAHTPGALEQALLAARGHTQNKLICVFGCGGDRDKGKRPLMAQTAEALADSVIVTDDNPRTESAIAIFEDIEAGFKDQQSVVFEHDRKTAIQLAVQQANQGDVVLIAGKGHETVQIINNNLIPFDDRIEASNALREKAA